MYSMVKQPENSILVFGARIFLSLTFELIMHWHWLVRSELLKLVSTEGFKIANL